MAKINKSIRNNISRKKEQLESARSRLKKEFTGIDQVIDSLVQSIGWWYIFPEMQERPLVVNLWGMTGVGKTSLVIRLAQLLKFEKKFYHFDLGANSDAASSIKTHLKALFNHSNGEPAMIALDEFQHARTLAEDGNEIDKFYSRVIWELLDSGKFQASRLNSDTDVLHELLEEVRFFVSKGVKVREGKVVEKKDLFRKMKTIFHYRGRLAEDISLDFLPHDALEDLYELSGGRFGNFYEFRAHLLRLDGRATQRFLEELAEHANSRKTVDCSKTLVLVMGNLDEAYTMSGNFNPDISADEFHELSLRIGLPEVKSALRCRFRNEQIARLGNNHIIYPAFNNEGFRKLIDRELENLSGKIREKFGWELSFSGSMKRLIYREGVFPTQGTRPLFSTIRQLVHSRVTRIVYEAGMRKLDPETVSMSFENEMIVVKYFRKGKMLYVFKEKPELSLEKLRKPKRGDAQAVNAVHESGHALVSLLLMKTVPQCIYSETVDTSTSGYVLMKSGRKFLSRKDLGGQIAVYLGGIVAEEIVFGSENITTGSEDDLRRATALAASAVREYGMGRLMGAIQVCDYRRNGYIHDISHEHNRMVEELLEEARQLAEAVLRENQVLLLQMANYLSDYRTMPKEIILRFVKRFSPLAEDDLTRDPDQVFFRKWLKEKVAALDTRAIPGERNGNNLIYLNRETGDQKIST